MAQARFHQWEDDDLTRLMNQKFIGLIEPGPYRGFHANSMPAGLDLILSHGTDWFGPNGSTESTYDEVPGSVGNIGVLFTKQGVVIKETGAIVLPIAANPGGNPRIDRIVCRSVYVEVPGGNLATYAVYTGTPAANPAPPAISFPNEEIILGELRVPAGFASMDDDGVIWTRTVPPPFAQQLFTMFMNKFQISTEMKTFEEIGFMRSSGVLNGLDTIEVDVQDPTTLEWDEANGTLISVNVVAPTDYIFTNIKAKNPNNRIFLLTFTGSGAAGSTLKLHFNNFVTPTPQRNPPWNSDNVSRKHLQVYEGDVVAVIGENSLGTLFRVLWHHSGKTARYDRRLTMEHSLLLARGGVVLDAGVEQYFDWKANIIEIPYAASAALSSLKPSDGVVQENVLPFGYEVTVTPRYTGSSIQSDIFTLVPGGNIITINSQPIALPWNRPFTLISVPSPNGAGAAKWMLKDCLFGMEIDISAVHLADPTTITTPDAGTVVWGLTSFSRCVFHMDGVRCRMKIRTRITITGTVNLIDVRIPAGMTIRGSGDPTQIDLVGYGTCNNTEPLKIYVSTAYGSFVRCARVDGTPFTAGYVILEMNCDVDTFPSF